MEEKQILLLLRITPIVAAGLMFMLFQVLRHDYHPERLVMKTWREISGFVKTRQKGSGWYMRTKLWLDKNGSAFHYGRWLDPGRYLALRIVISLMGLLLISSISREVGVIVAVLLFFLPGMLLVYLNGRDNERLLPELKL